MYDILIILMLDTNNYLLLKSDNFSGKRETKF